MTDPLEMMARNTWQTQVYAVCSHFGVQIPSFDEWQVLVSKWVPGTKARDTVQTLVEMRKAEEEK